MRPYGRLKPQPGYHTPKGGDQKQKRGAWKASKDYLDGCGGDHPGRCLEKADTRFFIKESEEEMTTKFKYTKIPNTVDIITLPPGKYYVGDLCYVFEDDEWGRMLDDISNQRDENLHWGAIQEGGFEVEGKKFWFHGTAYGDGGYEDQFGKVYAVDSGTIGIIPEELIHNKYRDQINNLGRLHQWKEEVVCHYDDDTFFIGELEIPTGYENEE